MTADEMFEKIGYVKICDDEKVAYCNEQDEFDTYVIFDKIDKDIGIATNGIDYSVGEHPAFSLDELKAINKKVEELGW